MNTVSIQKGERMASIRKLKSGKWQVSIRKSNHKKIYKTFIEKAVAKRWAKQTEIQIKKGVYTDYGNAETITVKYLIIFVYFQIYDFLKMFFLTKSFSNDILFNFQRVHLIFFHLKKILIIIFLISRIQKYFFWSLPRS